ncbi:MAG: class I SAM-dependent methyltransferase [Gammaproteobacteria bacterium]|nr:class I SAM-dependent methyltransferase [Gammaproteobacteria bacterium]MCY4218214.1 class I SAM-dependent methyltransferase [Gammaproteobacteria bacterium]MCY4274860.1 class I SAM-dependent methyltransferase [Gammaproteobacteria bacterium]
MAKNPVKNSVQMYQYILDNTLKESKILRLLRETTSTMEKSMMQISPDQGQFMALMVKLMGATTIIEIGTFTGYSALVMAQALPVNGKLIACDVSHEWTSIGRTYWEQAGVNQKIDLRLAPALDTLNELLETGFKEDVDMVFIDADKENGITYYELTLQLLRPGGLVIIDNAFWGGAVAEPDNTEVDTEAIRELTRLIHEDVRVESSMIAVGDGLLLARKCEMGF